MQQTLSLDMNYVKQSADLYQVKAGSRDSYELSSTLQLNNYFTIPY